MNANTAPEDDQTGLESWVKLPTSPPPSPLTSKKWFRVIALTLVIVNLALVGTYAYLNKDNLINTNRDGGGPTIGELNPQNTPDVQAEKADTSKLSQFQKLLSEKCVEDNTNDNPLINFDDLPIKLPTHLNDFYGQKTKCWYLTKDDYGGFVTIETLVGVFHIYDKHSIEGAHGGYPFLGSPGQNLLNRNSVKISTYLSVPEIGEAKLYIPLIAVGEREITFSNGEKVFVNASRVILSVSNKRLREAEFKYSLPSGESNPYPDERYLPALNETKVLNTLFSDPNNLASPEKELLRELEDDLNGFLLK